MSPERDPYTISSYKRTLNAAVLLLVQRQSRPPSRPPSRASRIATTGLCAVALAEPLQLAWHWLLAALP